MFVASAGVHAQVTAEPRDEPSSPQTRFEFGLLVGHAMLPTSQGGYIGTIPTYTGYFESEPENLVEGFQVQISEYGQYRPIFGAVSELHLTQDLGLEASFLSRIDRSTFHVVKYDEHAGLRYEGIPSPEESWEIPIIMKYRFNLTRFKPFIGGGIAFRIPDYGNTKARAITSVFGIEFRGPKRLKISPQIRYNYWLLPDWLSSRPNSVNRNQVHFLVGFSFGF